MSQNRPKNYAVRLRDGHKNSTALNVYEWQGSGPPLLLVHAAGFHARVWDKVIAQLGDRHVYAVDLRNHGLSDNSAPPYSFQLFGDDLVALIEALDLSDITACGHSMGGHGALVLALRNPERYKSVSAFSPICNPVNCPWGRKAFSAYLGEDRKTWEAYDASLLMRQAQGGLPMLVDQGAEDDFLADQLKPEALEAAAEASGYPLTLRRQEGYDHSYYFISSFMDDHLRFHAEHLGA